MVADNENYNDNPNQNKSRDFMPHQATVPAKRPPGKSIRNEISPGPSCWAAFHNSLDHSVRQWGK